MTLILYDDTIQLQAAEFLEDLADTLAGVERCTACHQQFVTCACPELVAAGVVPVGGE